MIIVNLIIASLNLILKHQLKPDDVTNVKMKIVCHGKSIQKNSRGFLS